MKYRCIESFSVEGCNDDGFPYNIDVKIESGSVWEADKNADMIGGDIHLDDYASMKWVEISMENLERYFEPIN